MKQLLTNKGELQKYSIFQPTEIETLKNQIKRALQGCKGSFEESIYLDDEDKNGWVSLEGLKESVDIMELRLDP